MKDFDNSEIDKALYWQYQANYINTSDRSDKLKRDIKEFDGITSIAEARKLAKEKFQIDRDVYHINLEKANCVIIQSADLFRICYEDEKEFICYNIAKNRV